MLANETTELAIQYMRARRILDLLVATKHPLEKHSVIQAIEGSSPNTPQDFISPCALLPSQGITIIAIRPLVEEGVNNVSFDIAQGGQSEEHVRGDRRVQG